MKVKGARIPPDAQWEGNGQEAAELINEALAEMRAANERAQAFIASGVQSDRPYPEPDLEV